PRSLTPRSFSTVTRTEQQSGQSRAQTDRRISGTSAFQTRFQRDIGVEQFRNRTTGLRRFYSLIESFLACAGNARLQFQVALGDGESIALLFEGDGASGADAFGGQIGLPELSRERHREAAGVGRG